MTQLPPLPPQVCRIERCRKERRCFRAVMGGWPCLDRRTAQLQERQRAEAARVLPSIGHRPAEDRAGFGFQRPPMEHEVWCGAGQHDALRRRVLSFLILAHDRDYRARDMLMLRVRGDDSRRLWRVVSYVDAAADGLREGYIALGVQGA